MSHSIPAINIGIVTGLDLLTQRLDAAQPARGLTFRWRSLQQRIAVLDHRLHRIAPLVLLQSRLVPRSTGIGQTDGWVTAQRHPTSFPPI